MIYDASKRVYAVCRKGSGLPFVGISQADAELFAASFRRLFRYAKLAAEAPSPYISCSDSPTNHLLENLPLRGSRIACVLAATLPELKGQKDEIIPLLCRTAPLIPVPCGCCRCQPLMGILS